MTRMTLFTIPFLLLAACDGPETTAPDTNALEPEARSSSHDNSAQVWRETVEAYPFGPVPLSAPCLAGAVEDDATIQGTWTVRAHNLLKPGERYHLNEYIDYSDTEVTAGALTWAPAPGAQEKIVWHETASGPRNYIHEFHGRYLSQDGLADLRVYHWVHVTWDADGAIRHIDTQLFSADCLGS